MLICAICVSAVNVMRCRHVHTRPGPVYASDFATPDFLRDLYGVPRGLRVQHPDNSQCVTEFLEQYYSQQDLVRDITTCVCVHVMTSMDACT